MLGPTLLSLHNVHFYLDLVAQARLAIEEQRYASFLAENLVRWQSSTYNQQSDIETP